MGVMKMIIVLVSNDIKEMDFLSLLFKEALPEGECLQFVDPMLSLKYIANNPADLVLAAERMRPANGIELLRNIRKIIPELPVVIVAEDDTMRERAEKLAVDGYWEKPVTAQQLQTLDKILNP